MNAVTAKASTEIILPKLPYSIDGMGYKSISGQYNVGEAVVEVLFTQDYVPGKLAAASESTSLLRPAKKELLGKFKVTAYCDCRKCQGKWVGNTALGYPPTAGVTVAVDPNVVALGTNLYLDGLGNRVAQDTGGKIKGNRIDVFMESHKAAIAWGVRTVNVYTVK